MQLEWTRFDSAQVLLRLPLLRSVELLCAVEAGATGRACSPAISGSPALPGQAVASLSCSVLPALSVLTNRLRGCELRSSICRHLGS